MRYMVHPNVVFIIHKNGKSTRAWHILKSNSTSFWFPFFFLGSIIQLQLATVLFLYKVSIVVLIDFIAILLTTCIFLTQIGNTNMYFIYFHSKYIIKTSLPKVSKPLQAFIINFNSVKWIVLTSAKTSQQHFNGILKK